MMEKVCGCCLSAKTLENFSKHKRSKDGYQKYCKSCVSAYKKDYYVRNKQSILELRKEYYEENKDKVAGNVKSYQERNKDKIACYQVEYRANNKFRLNALKRKYEMSKLQATPKCLIDSDFAAMSEFYKEAELLSKQGSKFHVDHIVPIQSKLVCGLHVPWNLRVIHFKDNLSKSNKLDESLLDSLYSSYSPNNP